MTKQTFVCIDVGEAKPHPQRVKYGEKAMISRNTKIETSLDFEMVLFTIQNRLTAEEKRV